MKETVTATSETDPPPGSDRYRLIDRLDEGAMGVVWTAEDTALHRKVAVKLLHDRFLGAALQQQLAREARAMARLSHPNVVAVYDVGEMNGRTFVAMELIDGQPLTRWIETPRPWEDVLEVFRGIADGVAAAHAVGLVHRDIKPSNILLGRDGRPRIADFGVAHAASAGDDATATTTSTRGLIGSPAYMPPERLRGDPAGKKGDQFAFFAAFYEALHGERPFLAPTVGELADQIERGVPPPRREVPAWLHAVIARGLSADPDERHASMADVVAALRPPSAPSRPWLYTTVGVIAGAVIATAAALLVLDGSRAAAPPDARAAAVEPARAAPDAAPLPAPDAAVPPSDAAPRPKAKRTEKKESLAGLSTEELKQRFEAGRADMLATAERKDYSKASRIAEGLVPVARAYRGMPEEYQKMSVTYACAAGEAKRARTLFAKIIDREGDPWVGQFKQVARDICARHGIDLAK